MASTDGSSSSGSTPDPFAVPGPSKNPFDTPGPSAPPGGSSSSTMAARTDPQDPFTNQTLPMEAPFVNPAVDFDSTPPMYLYRPYRPPAYAKPIHGYPRVIGGNVFKAKMDYAMGLAITFVPWLIVGLALVAAIVLPWYLRYLHKGKVRRNKPLTRKMKALYGFLFVLLLGGCGLMMYATVQIAMGVNWTFTNIASGRDTLNQSVAAITSAQSAISNFTQVASDISVACNDTRITQAVDILTPQAEAISAGLKNMTHVQATLAKQLNKLSNNFKLGRMVGMPLGMGLAGFVALIGLLIVIMASVAMCLANKPHKAKARQRVSRCGCSCLMPLGFVCLVISMTLTGGFMAGNIGAADVCVSPDKNLLSLVDGEDYNFAMLYMFCLGPMATNLISLAQNASLLDVQATPLLAGITNTGGSVTQCQTVAEGWSTASADLTTYIDTLMTQSNKTTTLLGCPRLNRIYRRAVYDGLCLQTGGPTMMAWIGGLAADIGFLVLLALFLWVSNPFLLIQDGGGEKSRSGDVYPANTDDIDPETGLPSDSKRKKKKDKKNKKKKSKGADSSAENGLPRYEDVVSLSEFPDGQTPEDGLSRTQSKRKSKRSGSYSQNRLPLEPDVISLPDDYSQIDLPVETDRARGPPRRRSTRSGQLYDEYGYPVDEPEVYGHRLPSDPGFSRASRRSLPRDPGYIPQGYPVPANRHHRGHTDAHIHAGPYYGDEDAVYSEPEFYHEDEFEDRGMPPGRGGGGRYIGRSQTGNSVMMMQPPAAATRRGLSRSQTGGGAYNNSSSVRGSGGYGGYPPQQQHYPGTGTDEESEYEDYWRSLPVSNPANPRSVHRVYTSRRGEPLAPVPNAVYSNRSRGLNRAQTERYGEPPNHRYYGHQPQRRGDMQYYDDGVDDLEAEYWEARARRQPRSRSGGAPYGTRGYPRQRAPGREYEADVDSESEFSHEEGPALAPRPSRGVSGIPPRMRQSGGPGQNSPAAQGTPTSQSGRGPSRGGHSDVEEEQEEDENQTATASETEVSETEEMPGQVTPTAALPPGRGKPAPPPPVDSNTAQPRLPQARRGSLRSDGALTDTSLGQRKASCEVHGSRAEVEDEDPPVNGTSRGESLGPPEIPFSNQPGRGKPAPPPPVGAQPGSKNLSNAPTRSKGGKSSAQLETPKNETMSDTDSVYHEAYSALQAVRRTPSLDSHVVVID